MTTLASAYDNRRYTIEIWDHVNRRWRMDRQYIGIYAKRRVNWISAKTAIEKRDNPLLLRRAIDMSGAVYEMGV